MAEKPRVERPDKYRECEAGSVSGNPDLMAIVEKDPVREFRGDPRRLAHSVLNDLRQARAAIVEQLATIECKTFDEYRLRKGKIEGLDIAISVCQEVQRKLEA
jgi:hypothetical protein